MTEFLFGLRYFAVRLVAVMVFLVGLWNPSRYSYVGWLMAEPRDEMVGAKALVGILFLCALVYLAMTTHKTLGKIGLALCVAVIGTAAVLIVTNVHVAWTNSAMIIAGQLCVGVLFAFGLSAAVLNRRISGQVTTNQAGPVETHDGAHHA